MKTYIFWFSATGNSLSLARELAAAIPDSELIPIAGVINRQIPTSACIGLAYPVYALGIPALIEEFAHTLAATPETYIFSLATMERVAGAPHTELDRILRTHGCHLSAGWSVAMPGNYPILAPAPSDAKQKVFFENAQVRMASIVAAIKSRKSCAFENSLGPVGPLLASLRGLLKRGMYSNFKRSARRFVVDPQCIHCGTCSKVCPVQNITMAKGSPVWGDHCQHCMACLQWCPTEAIQLGNITRGRRRYHHPRIKVQDIILKK